MRAIIQRVSSANVKIEEKTAAKIDCGLLVLLGVADGDTSSDADFLAKKIAAMRIFCDSDDKMNLSVQDIGGSIIVVSNFTLCADASHGNRPSFIAAARPEIAEPLYEQFVHKLRENGVKNVQTGVFGADMNVGIENDGPVTIILDS
ncbi:MAG TPA: D-aminoacyl-tRNA deacylase [Oscillospiraceae bacterium]|nr:D-aminoacyl-tRNA deacylase [Oscillospiraceae bacterium]HPF55474.1 D-aminoacyl-tRNA deacylase [Clostridiales bacterium]HPK34308.1 D-aminoacyl-tRNA deacylase [Oscillospiraceae bacterium]HPR75087.1 D-aminoacyl-tRNA deacylase [Oscillospiraceae bacterium]